jgi:hypothetical protein
MKAGLDKASKEKIRMAKKGEGRERGWGREDGGRERMG